MGGWISRKFDEKTTITTAAWRGRTHGTTEIVTELTLYPVVDAKHEH